ncbi:MAG: MBL fold metallo-hydrolase, partial [Spirochaetaceae bacterium]|nr:MBL fold metallo-hydrolase [Spirochaetaceae bacterium]
MLLVDFINVGYGDAILAREYEGARLLFTLLVDTGDCNTGSPAGPSRRISAAAFLKREGVRRIDLLVLSHLHLDHAGGMFSICDQFEVGEFWTNCLPGKDLRDRRLSGRYDGGINNLINSLTIYTKALKSFDRKGVPLRPLGGKTEELSRLLTGKLGVGCFFAEAGLYREQDAIINGVLGGTMSPEALGPLDAWINDTSLR